MNQFIPQQSNPLTSFMRQPKIYIRLPSNGEYWPPGALDMPETRELPVFSMTAKDELMLKVPDALMNGQAIVDVIQNCIPSVKNAWATPGIDMDVMLIAIRLATYGEKMVTPLTFGDDIEMEYIVDLRTVMDSLMNQIAWNPVVAISDDLTVFVKPLTYKQMTESALQTFETQKIMQIANDDKMNEDDKLRMFKESFKKLTDATVGTVGAGIFRIDSTLGSTDNPSFIKEFIDNVDKDVFNVIEQHLTALKEQNTIKPIIVPVTNEMREKGISGETVEVPLTFDASTFFV
jgi:hypothetical protein